MFKFRFSESHSTKEYTMPRRDFISILQESLDESGSIDYEVKTKLLRLGDTIPKVDFSAWRCVGSCGCPLTLAGVVHIDNNDESGDGLPEELGGRFYTAFDNKMSRYHNHGAGGGGIVTII